MSDLDNDDDDKPALSTDTLLALKEFYADQTALSESHVPENWQLSQFWYDEDSSMALAQEVWTSCSPGNWVACVSCPSLYISLRKLQESDSVAEKPVHIYLFEFDDRFRKLAQDKFVLYDYNHATDIPPELHSKFDFIAADPPFLAENCLSEVAKTCKILRREEHTKILLCTGEIMEDCAASLLNVRRTSFIPVHKSKLSNTFASFTNYGPSVLEDRK